MIVGQQGYVQIVETLILYQICAYYALISERSGHVDSSLFRT